MGGGGGGTLVTSYVFLLYSGTASCVLCVIVGYDWQQLVRKPILILLVTIGTPQSFLIPSRDLFISMAVAPLLGSV